MEAIYMDCLDELGPLPTKWWIDLDEIVVEPVAELEPATAPTVGQRQRRAMSLPERVMSLPPYLVWGVLSLLALVVIVVAWVLL